MDAIQHNAGIRPSADGSDVALLKHMVTRCADSLTDTYERIRRQMIRLGLLLEIFGCGACRLHPSSMEAKRCGKEPSGTDLATRFKELRLSIKKVKDKPLTDGKNEVSCDHIHKFDKQYDEIIKTAYEEKSLHGTVAKKRGRKKNGNVLNLIGRLFPQREWRTGIPYHYKLHWNSIQAWSQCFYGNPGGIIM